MKSRPVKRALVLTFGWLLVALGVVGLALPVLQGVLLILLGFFVLSRESEWARRHFQDLREKFPGIDERLRNWKRKLPFSHEDP